jgi:hypothetical protein
MLKRLIYLSIWTVCILPVVAAEQTEIKYLSLDKHTIGRYEKFELTFTLSETYKNPFDPDIVDISVTITAPDASTRVVYAFYYMDYDIVDGKYVNGHNPCWKARFAPSQLGKYVVSQITINDKNGTTSVDPQVSFDCVPSERKGIIRIDRRDPYCLCYDDGSAYLPIGHNVAWDQAVYGIEAIAWWEQYFTAMAAVGENWTRIWMTHFYEGHTLVWTTKELPEYWGGVGWLSLQMAGKIDLMVELAEQNGIAIQLVFQHHGQFSTTVNSNWDKNPFNIVNRRADGGFLGNPEEFFTNAKAVRLTKYKYRYIVARWGYSDAILAWELWNEVQYTDAWKNSRQSDVVKWHEEMSDYLSSIDPFDHLITTSDDTSGFDAIWNLPNIDLVQVHYYGLGTAGFIKQAVSLLSRHEKPVIMGEFGRFDDENVAEAALVLHNGIWSAFHLKSGGHFWWWDYIHSHNLYDEFIPLTVYAEGEDLADHNLSAADIDVPGAGLYTNVVPGLKGFWDVSTQTTFIIPSDEKVAGIENLSQWLHGSSKSDYCSDPSFAIDFDNSGVLKIHVDEVSSWGQNSLCILLNGVQVFSESYANGLTNFVIEIPLPSGQQVVKIENTGQDWFCISSYEFQETTDTNSGHLQFIGLSGDNHAYIWIHDIGSQRGRSDHGVFSDVNCVFHGLADGDYIVDFYETRGEGGVFESNHAQSEDGGLVIAIPEFIRDIAFKIKPLELSTLKNFEAGDFNSQTKSQLSTDVVVKTSGLLLH